MYVWNSHAHQRWAAKGAKRGVSSSYVDLFLLISEKQVVKDVRLIQELQLDEVVNALHRRGVPLLDMEIGLVELDLLRRRISQ